MIDPVFKLKPKPLIWVGSSKKDFQVFPDSVKDDMGYALFMPQLGAKRGKAKPLKGFGGTNVIEIVADHRGDTFRTVYNRADSRPDFCTACVSEETEIRPCGAKIRDRTCQTAIDAGRTDSGGNLIMKKKLDVYEIGGGKLFADIGVPNAAEHIIKARLVVKIGHIIAERGLTQIAAAKRLGVKQPDISNMRRGQFRQFSVERLLRFLVALDHDVEIIVKKHRDRSSDPSLRLAI